LAAGFRPLCALAGSSSPLEVMSSWICLGGPSTGLNRDFQHPAGLTLLRHPIVSLSPFRWYRNVDLFSIAYAFRPRLRVRLTLSGLTFLRKPWVFGEQVSRLFYRYSCRHNHFRFVQRLLSRHLHPTTERSPTKSGHHRPEVRSFGTRL
jgi:hypothetical protein